MSRRPRVAVALQRVGWSTLSAVVLIATVPTGASGQGSPTTVEPKLELRAGASRVVYEREKGTEIYMDLGLHVASPNASFELRLHRDDYLDQVEVSQILHGAGNSVRDRSLPADVMAGWYGIDDFLLATVRNEDGEVAAEIAADFCPNSYDMQRVNDQGPQTPTYPSTCGASPFTKGMVWGIDRGWGARVQGLSDEPLYLRAGSYRVTVAIAPRYVEMFSLDPATTTAEVEFKVKTVDYDYPGAVGTARPKEDEQARPTDAATISPDPATLPDLVALPAWSMSIDKGRKRVRLNFSATVSVEGASSLVVEGFRRSGEDIMDAYQYFYSGDELVGRAPVGTMEFDDRDGHLHWHFQQFARYSLLDAEQNEIAPSRKESFCLAATDAIDLLIPGADRRVENSDLATACGSQDSLWVREILPLGWADTYSQTLPGQSFNITDLPNGKYYVSVEANPADHLYEQSADNNVELREIYLEGRGLNRRVEVPPWNGIDTEQGSGSDGGTDVLR